MENNGTTCVVCNKKFQSADSLSQHINDKKDKKHSFRDNNHKKDTEIRNMFQALSIKIKIAEKPYLTEDDKILLGKVQKFLIEEHERFKEKCKRENKRLGLPDDTPTNITLKALEEEYRRKIEESKKQIKESKTQIKDFNRQIKESNMKIVEMKKKFIKEGWDAIEKMANDMKEKGIPNYIEKIPIRPTEKIECNCPKKCEKEPFKKKGNNTILNMSIG